MDERSWWNLWNNSYRTNEDNDAVSSELFARVATVINEVTRAKTMRILEVACGTGTLSRMLLYSSYHGLDISSDAIHLAIQKSKDLQTPNGSESPTYEAADFHDWVPPHPFDLIVCVDAISCFRDQRLVLAKIRESLTPGGSLVLTTINPWVYNRIKRSWQNGPVSSWLSRHDLHALTESTGLVIDRSYTIMPRGTMGALRLLNSHRLNTAFGPRFEKALKTTKEGLGLGQYRLVVARKPL